MRLSLRIQVKSIDRKLALPFDKRIVDAIYHEGVLASLHICGDTFRILKDKVRTGATIITMVRIVDRNTQEVQCP